MAGDKYFFDNGGFQKEKAAVQTTTGVSDAGKIIALDSAGLLPVTMLPVGVGVETVSVVTSENLAAGAMVNLYSNSGTYTARNADATTNAKSADGFVLAAVTSPAVAIIYLIPSSGRNTAVTGLTIGSVYWLSTTPGAVTLTAPSASGNIVQRLGKATSATELFIENQSYYEKA